MPLSCHFYKKRFNNLLDRLRPLVSRFGSSLDLLSSYFWMNLDLKALASMSSPSETSSDMKSVSSSMTQVSWKSQSARPSTIRTCGNK